MHVASLTPAPSERNVYEAYATVALSVPCTCAMTHHVTYIIHAQTVYVDVPMSFIVFMSLLPESGLSSGL